MVDLAKIKTSYKILEKRIQYGEEISGEELACALEANNGTEKIPSLLLQYYKIAVLQGAPKKRGAKKKDNWGRDRMILALYDNCMRELSASTPTKRNPVAGSNPNTLEMQAAEQVKEKYKCCKNISLKRIINIASEIRSIIRAEQELPLKSRI